MNKNPLHKIERYKGYIEKYGIKYQPDFIINKETIVEVKYLNDRVGFSLNKKWSTYTGKKQDLKKKILKENGNYIWFTNEDIPNKFYRDCIKEIKNNMPP